MKTFLLLIAACVLMVSCNLFSNYGKKATIGKNEVYYKGEGVTESEAKAVGNFLVEKEWFSSEAPASAQLSKEDNMYTIRLVVADAKKVPAGSRLFMWKYQYDISHDLFDGKDTRFVFTNSKFEDMDALEPTAKLAVGKSSVFYDNSEFTKKQAQKLADYLLGQDYIGEAKDVDVFLLTKDEKPLVRLIVDKKAVEKNEEGILPTFSYWQWKMQEEVLDNKKLKVVLADVHMNDFKTVPKLTEEDRLKIEEQPATTTNALDSVSTQTKVSGIERIR